MQLKTTKFWFWQDADFFKKFTDNFSYATDTIVVFSMQKFCGPLREIGISPIPSPF